MKQKIFKIILFIAGLFVIGKEKISLDKPNLSNQPTEKTQNDFYYKPYCNLYISSQSINYGRRKEKEQNKNYGDLSDYIKVGQVSGISDTSSTISIHLI
jgi:hypothetical protein